MLFWFTERCRSRRAEIGTGLSVDGEGRKVEVYTFETFADSVGLGLGDRVEEVKAKIYVPKVAGDQNEKLICVHV